MRRAFSTYIYVKERLHSQHLDVLARGGAHAIELFCARGHFDYGGREHVREIAAWFQGNDVKLHSLHLPLFSDFDWGRDGTPPLNLIDQDKRRRIASMDEVKRALEVAEKISFPFAVQHLGVPNETFDPHKFDDAMTAVEHLRAFARPLGVTVLLENIPNEMSTPEKLMDLITAAHFKDVGVCFDFGHAHLAEGVVAAFEIMKPLIRSTHVHDNARDRDSHLWPGEGSIDWGEAMGALAKAPLVPPLLLEIEEQPGRDVARQSVAAFQMLETVGATAAQD